MKHTIKYTILLLTFVSWNSLWCQKINIAQVKQDMKRVADWQMAHFNDAFSKKKPHHPLDWTNGAFYVGLVKWAEIAGDDTYYKWLKKIGEDYNWKLYDRIYHADDHTVGQLYCDLYKKYPQKKIIKPTIKQFDYILYHPSKSALNWKTPFHLDRWNWCDALFMSPPVWAKLYKITGEKKYLDFMMKEYKATTKFLFDKKEQLYYRDERFMNKLDKGKKIFWSRGNGWVFAGLVNILNELEPKTKEYKYFLKIYKKMAKKLAQIQTPEGHWAMSLLAQEQYPTPEVSGTSFFVYGLAWGINKGILDYDTYEPVVKKGWNGTKKHITEEGMLGYVQPIGAAPGEAFPDKTEVYGAGAFLCAGYELINLLNTK
ncbi:glycoside hydrolase family 88 protein [Polaribacter sp.]|uniref:glycoside hydrolase family 88/105 protein n=1 Tax=Polaribacter sp. TaxID=1920175 RepID=UPI0025FC368E|nr:glycoside hydrolase family 88 protein [Polaribacter sp.]